MSVGGGSTSLPGDLEFQQLDQRCKQQQAEAAQRQLGHPNALLWRSEQPDQKRGHPHNQSDLEKHCPAIIAGARSDFAATPILFT